MDILNNILVDENGEQHYTPGNYIGSNIKPRFIILHCTATASPFARNVDSMLRPAYEASVHLLIGREGEFHQFVPFDCKASHSGENHWHDVYHNMDRHSIGIEMLNAGPLKTDDQNEYYRENAGIRYVIPEEDRVLINNRWWQIYPQAQLDALLGIVNLLFQRYEALEELLGHNEINPKFRSDDPGPAFPMQWFHARILGLEENLPITRVHVTARYSRLYAGPGEDQEQLGEGFPQNTPMGILKEQDGWVYVHLNPDDGHPPFTLGWIQSDRIKEDSVKPRHYHRPADIELPPGL